MGFAAVQHCGGMACPKPRVLELSAPVMLHWGRRGRNAFYIIIVIVIVVIFTVTVILHFENENILYYICV